MKYNFDEFVDRRGTYCVKYDAMASVIGRDVAEDVIPMWVADMDFKSPQCIVDALKKRLEHEVFGYTIKPDLFFESIVEWVKKRHQWDIQKDWISFCPGVVSGLTIAIEQFTKPGDKVIVQPPVYFPFFSSVENIGRKIVYNQLKIEDGKYKFNIEDLKNKIDADTKILILSNPHNPVGRVWTRDELLEISNICNENNVLVISDEIHADVVYAPAKHIPYASISKEAAQNSITVMSHSKTFNVAGLSTSFVITENKELLNQYNKISATYHLNLGNLFGTEALIAAYKEGEEWVDELLQYLKGNIDYVTTFIEQNIPNLKVVVPEATFLMWIDCSSLGMNSKELNDFFLNKVKVAVNEGSIFGLGGEGFIRLNIGCPRNTVVKALNQLKQAIECI